MTTVSWSVATRALFNKTKICWFIIFYEFDFGFQERGRKRERERLGVIASVVEGERVCVWRDAGMDECGEKGDREFLGVS